MKERLTLPVLTLAIAVAASAQTPSGEEFQVNTSPAGDVAPALAADASGNFVVVWSGRRGTSSTEILGQLFTSTGQALSGEFQINSYVQEEQYSPAVARGADGDFTVVWTSYESYYARHDIHGQRYDSTGKALGSELLVNTYTTDFQWDPAAAEDGRGNVVVVWSSFEQDGESFGIFGQSYDPDGAPLGGEFQVNTFTTDSQYRPSVAADEGGFFVVWESSGLDGSGTGIQGRRYDSAGEAVGGELQVNTYTTGNQHSPQVAVDGSGDFVVVWSTRPYLQGYIQGQRFDSAGLRIGWEFQVNATTTQDRRFPALAADPNGDFVVVWISYSSYGSFSHYLLARRFGSTGLALGGEFQVNAYTNRRQSFPAVATNAAGGFVVVWSFIEDGFTDKGLRGQRFCTRGEAGSACIFLDGFESSDVTAWSVLVP